VKADVVPCQPSHPSVDKPNAPETGRNRDAILTALRRRFRTCTSVLEIGSGTGQHAVHLAAAMPHLVWQTTDRPENLAGIRLWLDEAGLQNTPTPIVLDVNDPPSFGQRFDAVFSANTLHVLGLTEIERLFSLLPRVMAPGALLAIYGPFKYEGCFRSFDHACFDALLRLDDPHRGIRDFEVINAMASTVGLQLVEDRPMPTRCRCIFWGREAKRGPVRIK
jgi:SAM-dependent methyltransferase